MSKYKARILNPENLSWAWKKARKLYSHADGLTDFGEVASFELDLENQLRRIRRELESGSFHMRPLIHVPQPKKPEKDKERLRQFFHVSTRDQVAWLAVVNVIGPILDSQMPNWSYGNRLYKAAWFEEHDGHERLELGPYRHSRGWLYRKFQHSWPLFRRHISLTARTMVDGIGDPDFLDGPDRAAFTYSERPQYLSPAHWPAQDSSLLHYVSFDLERFYPSVRSEAVFRAISSFLPDIEDDEWLVETLRRLLSFNVGRKGSCLLGSDLVQPVTDSGAFYGVPTGLMVAGFLANTAMLPVDQETDQELCGQRKLAHFRFVDDHVVIGYRFSDLVDWIRDYESRLERLEIGPKISPTKYDPPDMANALQHDASLEIISRLKVETEIDGHRPVKLMTKTLALVSEIAGTDFDILPEQSRGQRLGELEWLLLSNLPDREIRADTRVSFAASQLASLVPVTFTPSPELLEASRQVSRARRQRDEQGGDERDKIVSEAIAVLQWRSRVDVERYANLVGRYFRLLFQAFCDHPDKPRLFSRVIEYCRLTGHDGIGEVLEWIADNLEGSRRATAEYLSSLVVQALAKHVASATFDAGNRRILARERRAARAFLLSVGAKKAKESLKRILAAQREAHHCDTSALVSLQAAVACAVLILKRKPAGQAVTSRLRGISQLLGAPEFDAPSDQWKEATGHSLGVWQHFIEMAQRHGRAKGAWRATAPFLNPQISQDWSNLRKYPASLPPAPSGTVEPDRLPRLQPSDAGWLLEVHGRGRNVLTAMFDPGRAGSLLERHFAARDRSVGYASALEWIQFVRELPPTDPRASEWSALELVHGLLKRIGTFGEGRIEDLDDLHPANVLIPAEWFDDSSQSGPPCWSWEQWKVRTATSPKPRCAEVKIKDYRIQPAEQGAPPDHEAAWARRLRGLGLLLFALVRKDFSVPPIWNVRGLERNISGFVREEFEEMTVSSITQSIIEACTMTRSVETAMIRSAPWAFYGLRPVDVVTDTRSDPPFIKDCDDLLELVQDAQATLERNQITVLNHAPRQLVPLNVVQLAGLAVELLPEDEGL